MTLKWLSHQGVFFKGHLQVANQQQQKSFFKHKKETEIFFLFRLAIARQLLSEDFEGQMTQAVFQFTIGIVTSGKRDQDYVSIILTTDPVKGRRDYRSRRNCDLPGR